MRALGKRLLIIPFVVTHSLGALLDANVSGHGVSKVPFEGSPLQGRRAGGDEVQGDETTADEILRAGTRGEMEAVVPVGAGSERFVFAGEWGRRGSDSKVTSSVTEELVADGIARGGVRESGNRAVSNSAADLVGGELGGAVLAGVAPTGAARMRAVAARTFVLRGRGLVIFRKKLGLTGAPGIEVRVVVEGFRKGDDVLRVGESGDDNPAIDSTGDGAAGEELKDSEVCDEAG